MSQPADGMTGAPHGTPRPVDRPGEFPFAALPLDHGHIVGMGGGLTEAGADLVAVDDPDPASVVAVRERFRRSRVAGVASLVVVAALLGGVGVLAALARGIVIVLPRLLIWRWRRSAATPGALLVASLGINVNALLPIALHLAWTAWLVVQSG